MSEKVVCEHGKTAAHLVKSGNRFIDDWICYGPVVDGRRIWAPQRAGELRAERDALQIDVKLLSELFAASQKDVEVLRARVTELEAQAGIQVDVRRTMELHAVETKQLRERADALERELTVARKWAAAWKDCAPRAREYKRLWENEYEKSNSLEKRVADLVHALDEETQRCVKAEKRVKELEADIDHARQVTGDEFGSLGGAVCRMKVCLQSKLFSAIAVLKRVENAGLNGCPECQRLNHHAPDCALAACLKGEQP